MFKKLLCIFALFFSTGFAYEYEVAICAIFRNEARFLREWIEYHRLIGVEHFWLYNNLSDDHFEEVLAPYVEAGIVECIDWPYESTCPEEWRPTQHAAYNDCVKKRALQVARWVCFIDSDEFIYLKNSEPLPIFLRNYARFGGLGVQWQLHGSSGIERLAEGELLTEHMVMRAEKNYLFNRNYKTFVRPECVQAFRSAHYPLFKWRFFHVDESRRRLPKSYFSPRYTTSQIKLIHYWARDEEYFEEEKVARRLKFGKSLDHIYDMKMHIDTVYDPCMHRYLPELKQRIGLLSTNY